MTMSALLRLHAVTSGRFPGPMHRANSHTLPHASLTAMTRAVFRLRASMVVAVTSTTATPAMRQSLPRVGMHPKLLGRFSATIAASRAEVTGGTPRHGNVPPASN
jgi:ABC-type hemin transport system substrate-binding protein